MLVSYIMMNAMNRMNNPNITFDIIDVKKIKNKKKE